MSEKTLKALHKIAYIEALGKPGSAQPRWLKDSQRDWSIGGLFRGFRETADIHRRMSEELGYGPLTSALLSPEQFKRMDEWYAKNRHRYGQQTAQQPQQPQQPAKQPQPAQKPQTPKVNPLTGPLYPPSKRGFPSWFDKVDWSKISREFSNDPKSWQTGGLFDRSNPLFK